MRQTITQQSRMAEVSIIAAMTRDRVIGTDGRLPWHLPEDLSQFRRLTSGNTVIMGRRTYLSIGRPLPDRHNIVLSRTMTKLPGASVCRSFMEGLAAASQRGRPVFIIGGAELYRSALLIAGELHISWVLENYKGDRLFPEFDLADWTICEEQAYQAFHYTKYRRKAC